MKLSELEAQERKTIADAAEKALKEQREAEQRQRDGLNFLAGCVAEMIRRDDGIYPDDTLQFLTVTTSGGNSGLLTVNSDTTRTKYDLPYFWIATLDISDHEIVYRAGRTVRDNECEFRTLWDFSGWYVKGEGTEALPLAQALVAAADAYKAAQETKDIPF